MDDRFERFEEQFRRSERQSRRLTGSLLLAVSLPPLLIALWLATNVLRQQFFGARAPGEVVEISGDVPTLIVEFDAGGGERRRVESAGSDLYRHYAVGDRVTVLFDPQKPQDATLDLFVETWLLPALLGGFGGFFALPLLFMPGLRPWRREREESPRRGSVIE
ncbi:DUF3592 domain-containing protein [Solimonas soli]|uniref:DUF3592 domain-containing protein n=1 Tax=Solimonas soli TaxID=413479 RepID=UPI000481BB55|nr:DUF3592 domain-containing protein [Solimonas soli]